MAISILPLLILLLVLMGGVAGIVLIILGIRGRGGDAGDAGTCGKCGYMVRGISTLACPECGADLRETGIRPSGRASNTGMLIAGVLLVTVCFGCTCFAIFGAFLRYDSAQPQQIHIQTAPAPTQTQPSPPPPTQWTPGQPAPNQSSP